METFTNFIRESEKLKTFRNYVRIFTFISDECIQKVWKNLKTAYYRSFRKKDGSPTYYRTAQMNFLDPYIPLDITEEVEILSKKAREIQYQVNIISDRIEEIRNTDVPPVILTMEDVVRHDHNYYKDE